MMPPSDSRITVEYYSRSYYWTQLHFRVRL